MFVIRDFFCLNSLNNFQELCTKACGEKIKCVNLRHLMDVLHNFYDFRTYERGVTYNY